MPEHPPASATSNPLFKACCRAGTSFALLPATSRFPSACPGLRKQPDYGQVCESGTSSYDRALIHVPAIWTMGNLGRAGYGATTEGKWMTGAIQHLLTDWLLGMWPYSYDTCDLGTFPNQTAQDGTPGAYATAGSLSGNELSFLPGQRTSACTCPGGDHPGPSNNVGRSAPEIDIFETQINVTLFKAEVSQSLQTAPFNYKYEFVNTSDATTIYDDTITQFNSYKGGTTQQGVSATTIIDSQNFGGNGYATYGYEWWSNPSKRSEGYVTWYSQGVESWKVTAASIGPDPLTQVSQRLIPEEPMVSAPIAC